jgi:hypothetical protein
LTASPLGEAFLWALFFTGCVPVMNRQTGKGGWHNLCHLISAAAVVCLAGF